MALRPTVVTSRDASQMRGVNEDPTITKIVKYIPAEMVALYTTLRGIIIDSQAQTAECVMYKVIFLAVLILTPLYMYVATRDPQKKETAWFQIVVATLSYCVWVYCFGDVFQWCWVPFGTYNGRYGAVVLLIFTAIVPLLEKIVIKPAAVPTNI
jgi:hypothetical protein